MQVYPDSLPAGGSPFDREAALHLAMGMFDGVHRGHQVVVRAAVREAAGTKGDLSGVLTFDPHPSRILYPEKATPLLYPLQNRVDCLLELGVDRVLVQPFDGAFAAREAESFLPWLKAVLPGLCSLHVGENFRFGARRRGGIETLKETAAHLDIDVVAHSRYEDEGDAISSSRIREKVRRGEIADVNRMLGRPYCAVGPVISGQGLGRGLGFPTLNICWNPEVAPRFGVYEVAVREDPGKPLRAAIANFGVRPTVTNDSEPVLEVHLLDPESGKDPFRKVCVEFLDFLRPERAFPDRSSLQAQIAADVERVRKRSGAQA